MSIPDIQSQPDTRKITIDKVGVKGIRYPIVVQDRENGIQHSVADLDIYVELPHQRRGTHMSRFLEVLNRYHTEVFIDKLDSFLNELKSTLKADTAYIDISFPFFIKKQAPVSKVVSLLGYDCFFNASYNNNFELWIGVKVPVTTLCPCSKAISVSGAHNQRSEIFIKVRCREFVWLEELIQLAEEHSSCEIFPLLKRSDEKFVTDKAYSNPKFVEDIVREITMELNKDKRITGFYVEAENFESIHAHNAYALISRI
ncbi:MAG TPA: GTP cyclohydrolase FolE2 [Candidatus Cloacimonas sp.]|nr:GTP cyclohydrolase FolE2 [Candidatus Cloacimonas sp.]HQM16316.1 GTP cyclohydrolase FolE2 [Candidatus Cloacimonas sp.]